MKFIFILLFALIHTATIAQSRDPVETHPQFPGGVAEMYGWIRKSIAYPGEAMKKNLQGKVWVKFLVEKDGTVSNPVVIKGYHDILNQEAIRVIMTFPKWIAGTKDGEAVNVYFTMPISFTIETNETRKRRRKQARNRNFADPNIQNRF